MGVVKDAKVYLAERGFPHSKKTTIYAGVRSGFLILPEEGGNWHLDWERLYSYARWLEESKTVPDGWVPIRDWVEGKRISLATVYRDIHSGAIPGGRYIRDRERGPQRIYYLDPEAADEHYGINKGMAGGEE